MQSKIFLSIVVSLSIFISGCWDFLDLDQAIIPTVASFDIADDKRFRYTITTYAPAIDPGSKRDSRIVAKDVESLGEFRQKRGYTTGDEYLLGQLQVILYSEEIAREGLAETTDLLFRSPRIKNTLVLAVVEGRGNDFMHFEEKEEESLGEFLTELLSRSQLESFLPTTTLHQLGIGIDDLGRNPIIPTINIINNRITLTGTAIFKKDKLIDKLDIPEAKILSFLRGVEGRGYMRFELKEDEEIIDAGTIIGNNTRKISVKREGGNFVFDINVKINANLVEHSGPQNFTEDEEHLRKIELRLAEDIKEECEKFIKKMQTEYKFDCIDITRFAQAKWRKDVNEMTDNGFIENAKINVNVEVIVVQKGEET